MFSAKTISDRICGLIYIATFANIIHLNLNRPTKIAVCAPGFRDNFVKLMQIIYEYHPACVKYFLSVMKVLSPQSDIS